MGSKIKFHWQRLESSTWDSEYMLLYPESKTVLDSQPSAPETFHTWFPVSVKTSVGTDASRRTRFPNMAPNMLYVWTFADCFTSRPCSHVYGYFWIRNFFFPDSKISPCTGIRIHSCTQDSSGNIGNRACVEVARLDTLMLVMTTVMMIMMMMMMTSTMNDDDDDDDDDDCDDDDEMLFWSLNVKLFLR